MAGGAETPNIAARPAIARLGACESARGPDADRRVKLLIQFAVEGSLSGAYSQQTDSTVDPGPVGTARQLALDEMRYHELGMFNLLYVVSGPYKDGKRFIWTNAACT